jgi:hypothetical protein
MISAFRVRGADGRRLHQIVVGDRAMVPSPPDRIGTYENGSRAYVDLPRSMVGVSGDTVFLVTFAPEADLTQSPPWSPEDLLMALPQTDDLPATGQPGPGPSFNVAGSDPATEVLLPKSVLGSPVKPTSESQYAPEVDIVRQLPSYELVLSLGLDPSTLSSAAGYTDSLSTFFVVATRVPGVDARSLVGSVVDDLANSGGASMPMETVDVEGRPVQVMSDQAVYAEDELLYWMMYFDIGDNFGSTMAPRPPIRDIAVDIVPQLP